ncbi:hypothetical protein DITRI_Ditri08aG0144300 [Diplodiscus trichospermus]
MELFDLAEEEFGLPGNGLLVLPCDATFMEYVIALIRRKPSKEMEKELILSVASGRCSYSYLYQQETSKQLPDVPYTSYGAYYLAIANISEPTIQNLQYRKIALPRTAKDAETNSCSTSSVVEKGHFVVYSVDQKRFVLPLEYLKNEMVMELFNLAEEQFGLPGNRLLVLPCDATFMEYVISLIKRKSKEMEKALILSIANGPCSSSYLYQQETSRQLPVWSF